MASAPIDDNFVKGLIAKDDVSGGDIAVQAKTTTGALYVHIDSSDVATGGTSATDDSAFIAGSGTGTPAMGFFSTDTVDANDVGVLAMDASRRLLVSIEVDNVGIGGGTQFAVDTAAGGTDTGTLALVVRDDSLTTLTPADGDYTQLRVNSTGALHVIGGGGGTEYTEDVATPNPIVGTATLIERDDVLSTVTPAEADWIGLRGTAEGALWVQDFNSDAILADTAAMDTNLATIAGAVAGGQMQVDIVADGAGLATSANQLADGHNVTIDNLISNEVYVRGSGTAGTADAAVLTIQGIASMTALLVDLGSNNDVTVAGVSTATKQDDIIADTGAIQTAVELIDDAIFADNAGFTLTTSSVMVAGGVFQTGTPGTLADNDAGAILLNSTAGQMVELMAGTQSIGILGANSGVDIGDVTLNAGTAAFGKLSANSGVDIGDVDVTSIIGVTFSNAAMQITGDEAHDAADAGNPIKIGGRAQEPTAALEEVTTDNDRIDAAFDRQGRLAVWMGYPVQTAIINDSTSGNNTIQAAAGAGLRIAVMGYHIVSDGTVDFRWEDGADGGSGIFTGQIPLQAREGLTAGYGMQPMWVGTADVLLNLELSANIVVHGQVSFIVMTD